MPKRRSQLLNMSRKRKVAIFDIDGTIFRSSLLIELTEALIEVGIFPSSVQNLYARSYKRWLERRGSYEKYLANVVTAFNSHVNGVRSNEFKRVAYQIARFHKNRV